MSDPIYQEADIIQARERLARALTRLTTLVGGIPEQFQLLERSRQDAVKRLKENAQLLESERAITSQRDSLSESTKNEIQTLAEKLKEAVTLINDRDAIIADQDTQIASYKKEVELRNSELIDASLQLSTLKQDIVSIQDEHQHMMRQLELLREERDSALKAIQERVSIDETVALKFTRDERLQLLKTVDGLIEKVDHLSQPNGHSH